MFGMMDRIKNYLYSLYEKPAVYKAGVKTIDTGASSMSQFATWFDYITRRRETSAQKNRRLQAQNQIIDRRLKQIEENLKIEEKQTIANLYKSLGLNENQIKEVNAYIEAEKQFEKEYMSRPHKKAINKYSLSGEYLPLFKTAEVDPQSVKVLRFPGIEISPLDKESFLGFAYGMKTEPKKDSSEKKVISPPIIRLEPIVEHMPEIHKKSTIAHELGHVLSQHGTTKEALITGLTSIANISKPKIVYNKYFEQLRTIHERQAEILHKNKEFAEIMRKTRDMSDDDASYYADQLFLGHYKQLAEIDELHKLKDKFRDYKPIPVQKIEPLQPMNFNSSAQPLQSLQHQYLQKPKVLPVYPNVASGQQQVIE